MIRREIRDDRICLLTFDRPESGANSFDAATLDELNEHLEVIERDASLRGVIIASAKKSIFIAGADLKTILQGAQTGEMRAFIAQGQSVVNRLAGLPPRERPRLVDGLPEGQDVRRACGLKIVGDCYALDPLGTAVRDAHVPRTCPGISPVAEMDAGADRGPVRFFAHREAAARGGAFESSIARLGHRELRRPVSVRNSGVK